MIDIDKRYCLWAASKIEEHAKIHYEKEYPHAIKITEALLYAVNMLRELSKYDVIECKNYEIANDKNE